MIASHRFTLSLPVLAGLFSLVAGTAYAATEGSAEVGHHSYAFTFLWIGLLLLVARLGSLVERVGQPSVLGELVAGVMLGNLGLVGIGAIDVVKSDQFIRFLAELGVVILLFQIGLESNMRKMSAVGVPALMVAIVGVVVPFVLGTYLVGPWLMPGHGNTTYLFLGAALTATSVGITARVFQDLKKLHLPEAQIVLGAAVIDDVIGLVILAVVSAIATAGTVSITEIAFISGKAVAFLAGSILIGQLMAPFLGRAFSKIHTGVGMKFTLAISFGLIVAAIAQMIGLAPIVGAFAAGLVLDPVHFKYFKDPHVVSDVKSAVEGASPEVKERVLRAIHPHAERHIEEIIAPLGLFLVPLFFVVTGMSVNIETLFDPKIILVALGITVVAFLGKVVAGFAAGNVRKMLVGWGMAPRGEVGLIFAAIGQSLGVVPDSVYSVIVVVVILTTLLTPPILTHMLKRA